MSAREQRAALRLLRPNTDDPTEVDAILAEAEALGVNPETPPAMTTLAGDVLAPHVPTADIGKGHYKYMCAFAHNANYATLQHFEEVGPAEDERSAVVRGRMGLEAVWNPVALTIDAHTSAVGRLLDYLGRDQWAWRAWQNQVARVMSEATESIATGEISGPGPQGD